MHGNRKHLYRAARLRLVGFTLAEILIALALIAVLVAVLLPTVTGQILKGDASRVAQDLNAVRAGIEQFVADVRRYPGRYTDLSTKITATQTDIHGNVYTAALVKRWAGPYVTKDTLEGIVQSGYGGSINNAFMKVLNTNAINYVTVVITGISGPDFDRVDAQIDGSTTDPRTTGQLRWVSLGGVDSTKFLAVPIQ